MRNLPLKLLALLCIFYPKLSYASSTNITSAQTTPVNINSDNQIINISGSGNLLVNTNTYSEAILNDESYSNIIINIEATSENDGITATGSKSAISFTSGSLSSLTISSGTVTSSSINGALYLNGSGGTTNITVGQDSGNSGIISVETDDANAISSLTSNNTDFTIENKATGIIKTNPSYGSGSSIYLLDEDSGSTVAIKNSGTITSSSYAIDINGFSGSLTNSGTINGNIVQHQADDFIITNSGTINGSIELGGGSSLILNAGTVTGRISMGTALSNSVNFNGGSLTGDIIYDGSVSVNADTVNNGNIGYMIGNLEPTPITSLTVSSGKSLTTTNGYIYSNNLSLGSGSSINVGSAGIETSGNFTVSGNSTLTATTLTIDSGSILELTLSNPSAASITLTGAATLSSSTTLNLTLPNTVASGTVITLLDASSSSSIATISSSDININSTGGNTYGLNTFTTSVSGNKLLLTATALSSPTLTSSNNQSAYDAIAGASTNGNLATIQTYLGSSNSSSQKEEVIKSTTAQVDNSTNRLAFNNIATTSSIISSRLESVRSNNFNPSIIDASFTNNLFNQNSAEALNSLRDNNLKSSYPMFITLKGDDAFSKSAMWIQTFGSKVAQGNTSAGDGYNANSSGVMIGADHKLSNDFILGLSSGYSKSSISARNAFKSTNIETYQAGIYTGYDAKSYFFNTSFGIALNNYYSDRYISLVGASAKANYTGISYTARSEIGKNYHFNNEILFAPTFVITASQNRVGSYSESGAGTLNLHVKNDSTNFFEGRLGGELSQLFVTKKGTSMRPQISASYGYDLAGNKQKSTSNFIGQNITFSSSGSKVAQGSLKLGTGVSFYTKKDVTLSLNYGFEHRSDYISNSGWLRVGYEF